MNRENVLQLMVTPVDPNTMVQVIFEYIFDRKGEYPKVTNINIDPFQLMLIQNNYHIALEWFVKKFHINILTNKNGEIIKIY